jgi:hypothetical protein
LVLHEEPEKQTERYGEQEWWRGGAEREGDPMGFLGIVGDLENVSPSEYAAMLTDVEAPMNPIRKRHRECLDIIKYPVMGMVRVGFL